MRHHIEHVILLHHASARQRGDGMTLRHGLLAVEFEVNVDDGHVAHLARAQVVHAEYPGRGQQGGAYRQRLFFRHRLVHQVVQCAPENTAPVRTIIRPTINAAIGSSKGTPSRLPAMPSATTSDDTASERACQALATSMLERTWSAMRNR